MKKNKTQNYLFRSLQRQGKKIKIAHRRVFQYVDVSTHQDVIETRVMTRAQFDKFLSENKDAINPLICQNGGETFVSVFNSDGELIGQDTAHCDSRDCYSRKEGVERALRKIFPRRSAVANIEEYPAVFTVVAGV